IFHSFIPADFFHCHLLSTAPAVSNLSETDRSPGYSLPPEAAWSAVPARFQARREAAFHIKRQKDNLPVLLSSSSFLRFLRSAYHNHVSAGLRLSLPVLEIKGRSLMSPLGPPDHPSHRTGVFWKDNG